MRPLFLKLRGFKGILSGMGKEEFEIDLSSLGGLVAIVGPNGSGKTTLLDSMHPFRVMPYRSKSYSPRSFSFYNECYGNDALKEFVFEYDGRTYRSVIKIDSERKKQEAYLYEMIDGGWKALCDGKTETYDRLVEEMLGSPELFFSSVFRCQEAKKLSDYSKGEIKDLFVELLVLDRIRRIGELAKEERSRTEREVELNRIERDRLKGLVEEGKESQKKIESLKAEIEATEKSIKDIEARIEEEKKKLQDLESKAREREELLRQQRSLEEKLKHFSAILARKEEINAANDDEGRLLCKLELLKSEGKQLERSIQEIQRKATQGKELEKEVERLKGELNSLIAERRHKAEVLKKELATSQRKLSLLSGVPCGDDLQKKCAFLKEAVEAKESIPELFKRLYELQQESEREKEVKARISKLNEEVKAFDSSQKECNLLISKKNELQKKTEEIEKELEKVRKTLALAGEVNLAEKTLPEFQRELEEVNKRIADIKIPATVERLKNTVLEYENKKRELFDRQKSLQHDLGASQMVVIQSEKAAKELERMEKELEGKNRDIEEWTLLEKAFSNDGIIALEIDAAGPSISTIANELLLQCFGSRFSVRIDTQVAKASGGLKEAFEITVFDTERNESKSLRTMSGGEKVWIEEAIARAIMIFNARKSGRTFKALFTDEKDGALDVDRKKEFMAMKRKVLEVGGYEVEFFISQSPDIQEMADQVIKIG